MRSSLLNAEFLHERDAFRSLLSECAYPIFLTLFSRFNCQLRLTLLRDKLRTERGDLAL
jgi:hypothetical protein